MKLKNKKTGEIAEFVVHKRIEDSKDGNQVYAPFVINPEEWEDYEEPKKHYWVIDDDGLLVCRTVGDFANEWMCKQIGNYFLSKEEAEKAVERLRAWTRLKDKGAEFYGWRRNQTGTYELYLRWEDRTPRSYEVKNDLDTLFGGGE